MGGYLCESELQVSANYAETARSLGRKRADLVEALEA